MLHSVRASFASVLSSYFQPTLFAAWHKTGKVIPCLPTPDRTGLLFYQWDFDTKERKEGEKDGWRLLLLADIYIYIGYAAWIRGQHSPEGDSRFLCIFQILHSKEYLLTWNGDFESCRRVARGFRAKTSGAAEFCVHTKKAIKGKKHPVERQKWRELYIGREIKTAHAAEEREQRKFTFLSSVLDRIPLFFARWKTHQLPPLPTPPAASAVPDGVIFNELGEQRKGVIRTPS